MRVRRIRDGRDRLLTGLPVNQAELAAGSFGLAVAVDTGRVRLYRLPWRTIDGVLPA